MSNRHPKPPPREHTAAEILHAIARTLTTPRPGGIGIAVPQEIHNLTRRTGAGPARLFLPASQTVHNLRRWADALDPVDSITATESAVGNGDMQIRVIGRIPRGPVVSVEQWVVDFPLGLIPDEDRVLTLEELRLLDGGA